MPRNSIRMPVGTWRSITYTYDDGCQIVLWGGTSVIRIRRILAGPKVMFIKILYAVFLIGRGNLPISPNPNLRLRTL